MLDVEHANADLARLEQDAALDRHYEPGIGKKYRWIMQLLRRSVTKRSQLYQFNSLRLEPLRNREPDWSMRINDKYRLIVRFEGEVPNERIIILDIEDYH